MTLGVKGWSWAESVSQTKALPEEPVALTCVQVAEAAGRAGGACCCNQ